VQISVNHAGGMCASDASGVLHENLIPIRAFPMSAPNLGVSLVDAQGHEWAWIEDLAALPENLRNVLDAQLAEREFQPEILRILDVSSYSTPSRWHVVTNRGETELVLKGEEDIRRLSSHRLLIAAENGLHFLIADTQQLDGASKRRLERFL